MEEGGSVGRLRREPTQQQGRVVSQTLLHPVSEQLEEVRDGTSLCSSDLDLWSAV